MTSEVLETRRDDGVVWLTLNRPTVRNALNTALLRDLLAELERVENDDADRVVVLAGAGGVFCAGGDLTEARSNEDRLTRLTLMNEVISALHASSRPTIAAVDGAAVGGGWSLALACDLVLASERAVFAAAFVQRALSLDMGISWQLVRLVGPQRARELTFFGDSVSARDAARLGLVNHVVGDDELSDLTRRWARNLAEGPRFALRSIKGLLADASRMSLADALDAETRQQRVNLSTDDAEEARRAFREKRKPDFSVRIHARPHPAEL